MTNYDLIFSEEELYNTIEQGINEALSNDKDKLRKMFLNTVVKHKLSKGIPKDTIIQAIKNVIRWKRNFE